MKKIFCLSLICLFFSAVLAQPAPDENLKRGKELFTAQEYEQATMVLNKCVNASNVKIKSECLQYRGQALARNSQFSKGLIDLSTAVRLTPADANAYFARGQAYYRNESANEALLDFNRALKINPANVEALYLRSLIYSETKNKAKELQDLSEIVRLDPKYHNAYWMRGYLYTEMMKLDNAIVDFTKAIELNPQDEDSYIGRGKAYQRNGNKEKAAEDFKMATKVKPDSNSGAESLKNLYLTRSEVVKKANEMSETGIPGEVLEFLDDYPEYGDEDNIIYHRAISNTEIGEFKTADIYFQKQFDIFIKEARKYFNKAESIFNGSTLSKEQIDTGLNSYSSATAKYRSAEQVNFIRASETERNGLAPAKRIPQNLLLYAEFKRLYEAATVKSGARHLQYDQTNQALIDYNRAIKLNPRSRAAFSGRAKVYRKQGQIKLAEADEAKVKTLPMR